MDKKRVLLLIAVIAYIVSPVDLFPGPIDDFLVTLLYAVFQARGLITE